MLPGKTATAVAKWAIDPCSLHGNTKIVFFFLVLYSQPVNWPFLTSLHMTCTHLRKKQTNSVLTIVQYILCVYGCTLNDMLQNCIIICEYVACAVYYN